MSPAENYENAYCGNRFGGSGYQGNAQNVEYSSTHTRARGSTETVTDDLRLRDRYLLRRFLKSPLPFRDVRE